jgi:protein-cysteine N-palmitoyltransferase HHAT
MCAMLIFNNYTNAFHCVQFASRPWYRHICAIGAVGNILMMMVANLVGFVVGIDGVRYLFSQLAGTMEGKLLSF